MFEGNLADPIRRVVLSLTALALQQMDLGEVDQSCDDETTVALKEVTNRVAQDACIYVRNTILIALIK